jgi:MFS family permease
MVGRMAQATIVANWFVKQRGLMMGITAVSIGIGTSVMAPVANGILQSTGWQVSYLFLGGSFIVLILFPVVLFIKARGRPEDRGFGPDGTSLTDQEVSTNPTMGENDDAAHEWTVREAFRTTALWGILIAMALSYMADYIVLFHGVASFEDRGLTSGTAISIFSLATLVSVIGRIGFGWMADRLDIKACMALMFGLQVVASPFLIAGGANIGMLYVFAIIWGLGYGGLGTLMPAISSQYFGRRHFGSIYGWITMGTVFGGAAGSALGGWIYDFQGDYTLAWYACIVMWVISAVTIYTLGRKPETIQLT